MNDQDVVGIANVFSGNSSLFEIGYRVFDVVPSPVFFVTVWDSTGLLPAAEYRINMAIQSDDLLVDRVETALRLRVEAGPYYGTGYSF